MNTEIKTKFDVNDWVYCCALGYNIEQEKPFLNTFKTKIIGASIELNLINGGLDEINGVVYSLKINYLCETGNIYENISKYDEKNVFKTEKEAVDNFLKVYDTYKIDSVQDVEKHKFGCKAKECKRYELNERI